MAISRKERLYFDSSVIVGYYDPEFAEDLRRVIVYARSERIAVKQKAQDRIYEETKNSTPLQHIEYFRNAVQKSCFREWWEHANSFAKDISSWPRESYQS